jgi:hypothetical protein
MPDPIEQHGQEVFHSCKASDFRSRVCRTDQSTNLREMRPPRDSSVRRRDEFGVPEQAPAHPLSIGQIFGGASIDSRGSCRKMDCRVIGRIEADERSRIIPERLSDDRHCEVLNRASESRMPCVEFADRSLQSGRSCARIHDKEVEFTFDRIVESVEHADSGQPLRCFVPFIAEPHQGHVDRPFGRDDVMGHRDVVVGGTRQVAEVPFHGFRYDMLVGE